MSERVLEEELARSTVPALDSVVPLAALVDELPFELCRRLFAVPVRRDEAEEAQVLIGRRTPRAEPEHDESAFHLKT